MDWNDLRYFVAVARSGSLTAAAGQLRVSQSTVSRRIDALEHGLGVILFSRRQAGYLLTDDGRALVPYAEKVEAAAADLSAYSASSSRDVTGVVRVATAENLASHLIIPALPVFYAKYPDVRLELVTGVASISLSRREADIALRLQRPQHGAVTIRRLGDMAYALYGSQAYMAALSSTPDGGRFAGHSFVGWDDGLAHLPPAAWLTRALEGAAPIMTATSLQGHLAAARAGMGLALLPCFLAEPDDSLVRVGEPSDTISQELWLVLHGDLAASARVRVVADFLTRLIHDRHGELSGNATKQPTDGFAKTH